VSTPLAPPSVASPPDLAALRARLAAMAHAEAWGAVAFGDPAVDAHLPPGGLALGALHEVTGAALEGETGTLAAAFTLCLLARLMARSGERRPAIWIAPVADLHPPGLAAYGIDPGRLLLAHSPRDADTLAAAELALRDGAAVAVVAEVGALSRLAARRLHLAAQAHGSTGFVLRRWPHGRPARSAESTRDGNSATTSWHLAPAPSLHEGGEPGWPRWRVALVQARGGRPGAWMMERTEGGGDAAHPLRVVAELADAAPARTQRSA
jgi:protein ImuA